MGPDADFTRRQGVPTMMKRMILMAALLVASTASLAQAQWNLSEFNAANLDPATTGNHAWWCGEMIPSCGGGDSAGGYGNNWDAELHFYDTVADPALGVGVAVTAQVNIDTELGFDFLYLEAETSSGWIPFATLDGQVQGVTVDVSFDYMGNDYAGPGGDQIHLRWRFVSDGAGSDEDCGYPSSGGAQIDLIQVTTTTGGAGAVETCEPGELHSWGVHSTVFKGRGLAADGGVLLAPGNGYCAVAPDPSDEEAICRLTMTESLADESQYNNLWDCVIAYPDSNWPIGAALEFGSHKSDGGGGTVCIGSMRMEKTDDDDDTWQLGIIDFPFTEYSLEGFLGGMQVFATDVTDVTAAGEPFVVGEVVVASGTTPEIGFHGYAPIEWTWLGGIPFAVTGGGTYMVDSIRLYHKDSSVCPPLEHVSMRGIDVPQFVLTDLGAGYDVGTTHNAALARFFADNPEWPDKTYPTTVDYDFMVAASTEFLIEEAAFDPAFCHAVEDSIRGWESRQGMFYEREGVDYYGAPVVSDSLYGYRLGYLVANGYLSGAIADEFTTVYWMVEGASTEEDLESIRTHVNGLVDMPWSPEDLEVVEIFSRMFNSSYDYWYGVYGIGDMPLDPLGQGMARRQDQGDI
jgi:hypothetical protein